MLIRKTFPVGMLQCNCTILADEQSKQALVIDPGDEVDTIVAHLQSMQLHVVAIVHTHAHIDHIGGAAELATHVHAPTYLHQGDNFLHAAIPMQATMLGMALPSVAPIDQELHAEQTIAFGAYELAVLHTPGHTPGSVSFVVPGEDLCFSGDTLFHGGIGRTDLPGGDQGTIETSIRDQLYQLNSAVLVIPGHGPNTTIDREKTANPFVQARS